jgi:cation-transporting ATPase 13A1
VLALGFKSIKTMERKEMKLLNRDAIETSLTFAGFLVLRCPLKRDSKETIVVGQLNRVLLF